MFSIRPHAQRSQNKRFKSLAAPQAEILEEQGILDRLKKVGQLTAVFAGELNAAAGLTPYGIRSLRVRRYKHI